MREKTIKKFKKVMCSFITFVFILTIIYPAFGSIKASAASSLYAYYDFNSTFSSRVNPSNSTLNWMTNSGSANWKTDSSVDNTYLEWSGFSAPGYRLQATLNKNCSSAYSIAMRFSFANIDTSYRKIIDYSNFASDNGFYFLNHKLVYYYNDGTSVTKTFGTTTFNTNQIIDLIITRDTSNNFKVYSVVDGVVNNEFSWYDSSGSACAYTNGSNTVFGFFSDDGTGSEFSSGGKVYSIKIYDYTLSDREIASAADPVALVCVNNSSVVSRTDKTPGINFNIPSAPSPSYGTFQGWYCQNNGQMYNPGQTMSIQTATTLIAKWKPNPPASAPSLLSRTDTSITLNNITGYEYGRSNGNSTIWQTSPIFTGLTPGVKYLFYQRYKQNAYGLSDVSESSPGAYIYTVPSPPSTSNVTYNYKNETISYGTGYTVKQNGMTLATGSAITDKLGTSANLTTNAVTDGNGIVCPESYPVAITLPARPAKPATVLSATSWNGAHDGKISGLNSTMEYKLNDDITWNSVGTGVSELTGLNENAVYNIRYKATDTSLYSNIQNVTVTPGPTDSTKPSSTLAILDTSFSWNALQTGTLFNIFFPVVKNVVITNADELSGLKSSKYYLDASGTMLSLSDLQDLSSENWQVPENKNMYSVPLVANSKAIVYVRNEDNAGNVGYYSTEGVIVDNIKPAYVGATDGESRIVDNDIEVTVTDTNLSTVKMFVGADDAVGISQTVGGGSSQVTLPRPESGQVDYKISATDRAGNEKNLLVSLIRATYTLDVTTPEFEDAVYGYFDVDAKSINILSTGNSNTTISSVEIDNTTDFELSTDVGTTVLCGTEDTSYTIKPKTSLAAGTHTVNLTITYDHGATVEKTITFTVTPKPITFTLEKTDFNYNAKPAAIKQLISGLVPEDNFVVDYTYSSLLDGPFVDDIPVDMGKWYVKANFDNSNYLLQQDVVEFNINEAVAGAIKVESKGDTKAPETVLATPTEQIQDSVLTDEDKKLVGYGEDANIFLEIKDISDKVTETDKKLVESKLEKNSKVIYLDISLFKQIGDKDAEKVTNTSDKIKISIKVPGEFINENGNIKRDYYVVRVHNGEAEIINGTFDKETKLFTFETDKFSTYTLSYSDTELVANTADNTVIGASIMMATVGMAGAYVSMQRRKIKFE